MSEDERRNLLKEILEDWVAGEPATSELSEKEEVDRFDIEIQVTYNLTLDQMRVVRKAADAAASIIKKREKKK
ncbi:hypothetical protein HY311_02185 [Candidatus Nomurabacteria bacterium]|nr:hypothetical protein [Candidatus Nomurabacteria bacterium]